ncbi:hypothetical protein HK102_006634 [Quaeritorhiza haematococci]|nr:hypothetical protein HK102_006634 [Quaeritorhiza haematococci]
MDVPESRELSNVCHALKGVVYVDEYPNAERKYTRLWEAASNNVYNINNNVAAIKKMVDLLGTARDTHDMRQKLHNTTEETRELIRQTSADIKSLISIDSSSSTNPQQRARRKATQQRLQKQFQDVLKRFQDVSKLSAEKSREYVAKAKAQHDRQLALEEEDHAEDAPLLGQRLQQLQTLDNEIEYNEALIAEREEELVNIEKSITEVNEIFRDLGTLVNEQQYMLDNIESNVTSVAVNMESATNELRRANRYQMRSRNLMCWLLLIFAVIGAILILVILR